MNELQRNMLVLIKSAITGTPGVLSDDFSIENMGRMAIFHQIVGLAYEGAVICGVDKESATMQKLFQMYYQQVLRNEKQLSGVNKLFEAFDENNIDYLPVKGVDMKKLYPSGAMRTMGDADVLIRVEQYDRIRPIMQALGYAEGDETDHELLWDLGALHLELHKQLVPTYHPDLQRYYGDGWKLAKLLRGNRYTFSPEDMYIFLFAHFIKHYRRGGIGLRHVLDIWLYREANVSMDMEYVQREMSKLRFWEFHENICLLIDFWFNGADADEKIEYISNYIFNSGSWGTHENHVRFMSMRSSRYYKNVKSERAKKVLFSIFPTVSMMEKRYPVLTKMPWLLPIFWPIRWVTALLFRRNNIRKTQQDLKNASDREISNYEQSLKYVGLHYDV